MARHVQASALRDLCAELGGLCEKLFGWCAIAVMIDPHDPRSIWRLARALVRLRQGAPTHKNIKYAGRSEDVIENKGHDDNMPDKKSDFVSENAGVTANFRPFLVHFVESGPKKYAQRRLLQIFAQRLVLHPGNSGGMQG